ncbi:hypothetical protein [Rhizomonospora bruguierae]|uniref:hypothetical protein n=1 Tax=Rhizomonospora bruguierae TaxID=1581705 RepID=UPI001BD09C31|nr:hypothetical protein [Micromonospora sp. NBRC 107566]
MLNERTAPELPWQLDLKLVMVDEKPAQYALYRRADVGARVVAWVFVLPDGSAVLLPTEPVGSRPILTTMDSVRRRWVRLMEAELVQVVGRQPLYMAA